MAFLFLLFCYCHYSLFLLGCLKCYRCHNGYRKVLSKTPSDFICVRMAILVCAPSYEGWEGERQLMPSIQEEARWGEVWYMDGKLCFEEVGGDGHERICVKSK